MQFKSHFVTVGQLLQNFKSWSAILTEKVNEGKLH